MTDSNDHNESVTVGAGGLWAKLKGRDPFLRFIVLLLTAGLIFLVNFNLRDWGHPFNLQKSFQEHSDFLVAERKARAEEHEEIRKWIRAFLYMNWICSPTITDPKLRTRCQELNLQIPPEVQGMMRDRGQ